MRVDRVDDGNEASRYIRVGYEYMAPNYQLPQDLFKIPATWKFALRRQAACDGPLPSDSKLKDIKTGRDTGETINPVRIINPDEKIPEGKVMPCYILVDVGIKKAT